MPYIINWPLDYTHKILPQMMSTKMNPTNEKVMKLSEIYLDFEFSVRLVAYNRSPQAYRNTLYFRQAIAPVRWSASEPNPRPT